MLKGGWRLGNENVKSFLVLVVEIAGLGLENFICSPRFCSTRYQHFFVLVLERIAGVGVAFRGYTRLGLGFLGMY